MSEGALSAAHVATKGRIADGEQLASSSIGRPLDAIVMGRTSTIEIDLTALQGEGSLAIPLLATTSFRVRRRWDLSSYLSVTTIDAEGVAGGVAFMTMTGRRRQLLAHIENECEKAKAALPSAPYR